jgi:hypothetical protein
LPGLALHHYPCTTGSEVERYLSTFSYIVWRRSITGQDRAIGSPNTGKSHGDIYARFFRVVDLVNWLEAEAWTGRQGAAEHLIRLDLVILDELGYLPFAQSGRQLLFYPPDQPPLFMS